MEVTNKNLIHLLNNLRNRQYPHFLNALMNLSTFLGEFLPTGFPLHSELIALAFRAVVCEAKEIKGLRFAFVDGVSIARCKSSKFQQPALFFVSAQ